MLRRFLGDQPAEVAALRGRVVEPGEVVDCPDRYPDQETDIVWPPTLWQPVDSAGDPIEPEAEQPGAVEEA